MWQDVTSKTENNLFALSYTHQNMTNGALCEEFRIILTAFEITSFPVILTFSKIYKYKTVWSSYYIHFSKQ